MFHVSMTYRPWATLEKGLEEAKARNWTVVDMKQDWKIIFPFEKK
jgi:hypothetical protein